MLAQVVWIPQQRLRAALFNTCENVGISATCQRCGIYSANIVMEVGAPFPFMCSATLVMLFKPLTKASQSSSPLLRSRNSKPMNHTLVPCTIPVCSGSIAVLGARMCAVAAAVAAEVRFRAAAARPRCRRVTCTPPDWLHTWPLSPLKAAPF